MLKDDIAYACVGWRLFVKKAVTFSYGKELSKTVRFTTLPFQLVAVAVCRVSYFVIASFYRCAAFIACLFTHRFLKNHIGFKFVVPRVV